MTYFHFSHKLYVKQVRTLDTFVNYIYTDMNTLLILLPLEILYFYTFLLVPLHPLSAEAKQIFKFKNKILE